MSGFDDETVATKQVRSIGAPWRCLRTRGRRRGYADSAVWEETDADRDIKDGEGAVT